ncbi:hypothetical protein K8942_01635 [Candidatus Peribacteria bacterium]|nr:MAG: hypothetical protein K8942_01635 [Candidatus Peribacteria bacterium]
MKEILSLIATVLAIMGNVPYLYDVITKKIQPHPYTWLVWSIVSAVTFSGQVVKGGGVGAIPTGVAEIFTIIIFLFSLQNGCRNIARRDTYFLIAALAGLIPWALTNDPTISVIVVVSIDVIAFIPTLIKASHNPHTEAPTLFTMNVLRHILTLFSLEAYNVATMLHSLAMIVMNAAMTIFIYTPQRIRKSHYP